MRVTVRGRDLHVELEPGEHDGLSLEELQLLGLVLAEDVGLVDKDPRDRGGRIIVHQDAGMPE